MGIPECKAWLVHKVVVLLGEEDRARLLESARAPVRRFVLDGGRDLDSWVPTAFLIEVLVLADSIAGRGDLSTAWQMGLEIAKSEIGPVQEIALRVLRPSLLMAVAPGLFGTHFRNSGRV